MHRMMMIFLLQNFHLRILQEKPSLADFSRKMHENGWLIIQAHPYRDGKTVAQEAAYLDGVEAVNQNPRHTPYNEKARDYAQANRLMMTGGSDAHRVEDVARSGVYVPDSMENIRDFVEYLRKNPCPEIIFPE